jgi:thiol-disulfide isomerase/thioredoxin
MQSIRHVLAVITVVMVGALAGFLGYQSAHHPRQLVSPLTAAPAAAAANAKAAVPDTVPDLSMPDLTGQQKSLRDYLGHPLIVNFWATWCGPCRREIPLLQQLRATYRHDGLEIVGIAVDFQKAVADFVAKTPISYPLLIGEDQGMAAAEKFGMEPVLPFSAFADAQGRIVAIKIGELHQDEADYILQQMRSVAEGKSSMTDARAAIADRLRELSVARAKAGDKDS